jgi:hypothetical protein
MRLDHHLRIPMKKEKHANVSKTSVTNLIAALAALRQKPLDCELAGEAKQLVCQCFRVGPVENIHQSGRLEQDDMCALNQFAVNQMYQCLMLRKHFPETYQKYVVHNWWAVEHWDDPVVGLDVTPQRALKTLMDISHCTDEEATRALDTAEGDFDKALGLLHVGCGV